MKPGIMDPRYNTVQEHKNLGAYGWIGPTYS
jgi:hypothetical protein